MRIVTTSAALVPALVLLSSCAFDSSSERFAVRDSAGISIVETTAQVLALPRNHHVPFVDEMLADSEGRIWQRDYRMPWEADDSPRAWTVYSPAGQAVGRIVLPGNLRVTQIQTDHIVGVTYNEADVSLVTVHRFVR